MQRFNEPPELKAETRAKVEAIWFRSACKEDPRCVWASQLLAQRGVKLSWRYARREQGMAWRALIGELAHLAITEAGIASEYDPVWRPLPRQPKANGGGRAYHKSLRNIRAADEDCSHIAENLRTLDLGQLTVANLDVPMRGWLRCVTETCLDYADSSIGGSASAKDVCLDFRALLMGEGNPCE